MNPYDLIRDAMPHMTDPSWRREATRYLASEPQECSDPDCAECAMARGDDSDIPLTLAVGGSSRPVVTSCASKAKRMVGRDRGRRMSLRFDKREAHHRSRMAWRAWTVRGDWDAGSPKVRPLTGYDVA